MSINSPNNQLQNNQLQKIKKTVDNIGKWIMSVQKKLNNDYERLLQGKEGWTYSDLTELSKEIKEKEAKLKELEGTLALFSKNNKSSKITVKILYEWQHLQTVARNHELLLEMKAVDSVIPEAFEHRAEINEYLKKIDKSNNGSVVVTEFAQAIEKYHQIVLLRKKVGLPQNQQALLDRELNVLCMKMVALAKKGKLKVTEKDIKFLDELRKKTKISKKEAKRGQEILLKLTIAELCFPTTSGDRKERVHFWMDSLKNSSDTDKMQKLSSKYMRYFQQVYDLANPVTGNPTSYSLEGDKAAPGITGLSFDSVGLSKLQM